MLFNSIEFLIYLPIVFIVYWIIPTSKRTAQNFILLVCSYVFYGWWDWRFLSLIFFSSFVDYIIGLKLDKEKKLNRRKFFLTLSITVNLGILCYFKYFNFFIDSFIDLLNLFGIEQSYYSLKVILPVGISFYTFQTLSYSLDIYYGKIRPIKDPIAFFAFVSFFPQLVAGPIERAKSLLPQFMKERYFDLNKAKDGSRQILWGFFKKIVIADNMSPRVDFVFENFSSLDGITLFLGVFYFTIQIYCDFSGYSDIAIGTARLFGFSLMRNFAYPYFSRDIAEFWRRWHISLSSWFRDYLYIPLGGSRGSKFKKTRNIIITFAVSGFWHGANWTFICWGLLNGLYYVPLMLRNRQKINVNIAGDGRLIPGIREISQITLTFLLTLLAWVFFRAENISHAIHYIWEMGTTGIRLNEVSMGFWLTFLLGMSLLFMEWIMRTKQHALQIEHLPVHLRWIIYISLTQVILILGNFHKVEFIYFQF